MKQWTKRISALALSAVLLAGAIPVGAEAADLSSFQDVSQSAYYAQAVDWAVENGITAGTSDTQFSPAATVTRAQAMTFLWRAAGSPEPSSTVSPFADVASGDLYYYKPVLWAVENGITAGVSQTEFGPHVTLAYDQIFTFLCRAAGDTPQSSDWSAGAVAWAKENGLTSALTFTAKGACPRSDVIYCLWKQFEGGETQEPDKTEETPTGLSDADGAKAAILNGFLSRTTYIDVSSYNLEPAVVEELVQEIADQQGENPYGISQVVCYPSDNGLARQVAVTYQSNQTDYEVFTEATQKVKARAEEIVADVVTSGMSDYDIAKALHDYLILHCDYDMRYYTGNLPLVSYSAQGALLEGTAVCAGYAKAYEILMETAGIPCEYVTGYANGYHAWNIVQIDGAWYHVDTTWDDPTNRGGDYIRYDYFLLSDSAMSRDHSRWSASHACTSTKYDNQNLPSTEEQEKEQEQQQQEQANAEIVQQFEEIVFRTLDSLPYQTQAELEAASDEELEAAYRVTIQLPDGQLDGTPLYQFFDDIRDEISVRYPDLRSAGMDVWGPSLSYYRDDIKAEQERRRAMEKEEQEQQQNQDEAAAQEIVPILEKAIAGMDCYTTTVTLTGYTDEAIEAACDKMETDGYTFDGYTYHSRWQDSDYQLSAKSGGVVTITNYKWSETEEQRYLDQINEAIDSGELEIVLQPGNYSDKPDKPWYYAAQAAGTAAEEGYTTPGGRVAGTDFIVSKTGIRTGSNEYSMQIQYLDLPQPDPETAVEDYIAQIQEAIRSGETELLIQCDNNTQLSYIQEAVETVNWHTRGSAYSFDGYTAGEDYWISYGYNTNSGFQIIRMTIGYPTEE